MRALMGTCQDLVFSNRTLPAQKEVINMKSLGFFALFFTVSVFASNPLIRICNTTGGIFHEVETSDDHLGLCKYGSALIDSLSVLEVTSNDNKSAAIEAFENTTSANCSEASGSTLEAQDLEGQSVDLCVFEDGSVIGSKTLEAGSTSPENAGLLKALQTRPDSH